MSLTKDWQQRPTAVAPGVLCGYDRCNIYESSKNEKIHYGVAPRPRGTVVAGSKSIGLMNNYADFLLKGHDFCYEI
jgi:hypothetical protein